MKLTTPKTKERNVMVIGMTGAGKSTTINYLNNGVEACKASGDSKTSCTAGTKKVTITHLNLNIFDSPGFGDTGDLTDTKIFAQLIQAINTETTTKALDGIILV